MTADAADGDRRSLLDALVCEAGVGDPRLTSDPLGPIRNLAAGWDTYADDLDKRATNARQYAADHANDPPRRLGPDIAELLDGADRNTVTALHYRSLARNLRDAIATTEQWWRGGVPF